MKQLSRVSPPSYVVPIRFFHFTRIGTENPIPNLYVGPFSEPFTNAPLEWIADQGFVQQGKGVRHSKWYNSTLRFWADPVDRLVHTHRVGGQPIQEVVGFGFDHLGRLCHNGEPLLYRPPVVIPPDEWQPAKFENVEPFHMGSLR